MLLLHSMEGAFRVIYVDQSKLDQVEYLLGQALQGNHILFSPELLQRVFHGKSVFDSITDEEAYAVEPHLEKVIGLPTIEEKHTYLEQLDNETLERVVWAYFNIVENSLYEAQGDKH
jgi:hypothetical protein